MRPTKGHIGYTVRMSARPQLRDLALRILEGESLAADKCVDLRHFADDAPGPVYTAPLIPGRSASIRLSSQSARSTQPPFSALEEAAVRGRLLHAMANHELQALELMALALLRFPRADRRFRRGLAHVMADEQSHLSMYVQRMEALGVQLSDLPLSDFFWRALRSPSDPLTFVVQMGLVLEQANLDFASHWSQRMRAAGDAETAELLDRVYAEEVGHVRHGVVWATRWKNDHDTLWETFLAHTTEPMTPARAIGPTFDRTARTRAGLPSDFVDRLQTVGMSRGRPADVWWFHPDAEGARAHALRTPSPYQPKKGIARLSSDLAALPAVLATAGDIVLVHEPPRPDWLAHRLQAGLPTVQLVHDPDQLANRTLGAARPWGWSPVSHARARSLSLPSEEPSRAPDLGAKRWGLAASRELLAHAPEPFWSPISVVPIECRSLQAILDHQTHLATLGYPAVVVKGDWSASGQHRRVLRDRAPLPDGERTRLEGLLRRHGTVTVGPWLERILDFSFHGDVAADGTVQVRGVVRFDTHADGRFAGAHIGPPHRDLPRELVRWLLNDGRDPDRLGRTAQRVLTRLGPLLAAAGHRGPVGVDALVHRTSSGFALWPMVEVNPRWTMGRVALALRGSVRGSACLRLVRRGQHPLIGAPSHTPLPAPTHATGSIWLTDPREAEIAAVVERPTRQN